ncbi:uncharacterized protein MEPE_05125 [Melanopsichium pennsylvanicum]|uniref:Uncharacterized protein n=1 Tax=Melanopsichium pennsylvanicum TaxID=63383 RepID=A0AAJ5C704_9BASI|nr:uncharacterized protein MEPE_05125 [Melanopsichium pennsylvanicum]
MTSQDLQWHLVHNNSSFIVKQKGLGRIFFCKPHNLTQLHSYRIRDTTHIYKYGSARLWSHHLMHILQYNQKHFVSATSQAAMQLDSRADHGIDGKGSICDGGNQRHAGMTRGPIDAQGATEREHAGVLGSTLPKD